MASAPQPPRACSSVGLERVPPEHKVRGSSPFRRASFLLGQGPALCMMINRGFDS